MSKPARWLDLIAFLLHHRFPVTREDIFEAVSGYVDDSDDDEDKDDSKRRESARRKFERDKDELRSMGIGIETLELADRAGDEPSTGYRLRATGFYLPYLQLDESPAPPERPYPSLRTLEFSHDDLHMLDRATSRLAEHPSLPLRESARSVRRKLAFDLPIPLERIERVLGESGREEPDDTLEVLQQAVMRRRAVSCRYYTIGRDAESERELEPYGLFFNWGHWYCVAADRGGGDARVFRVDRITNASLARDEDAEFEKPEDFDIRTYLGRSAWELSETRATPVVVRFRFPESRWVMAQGAGQVLEPMTEDGGAVIEFAVRDEQPFLRWLLTFRNHAEIQRPRALGRELDTLRGRVAAVYADDV